MYFMEHWKNLSLENLIEEFEGILYTEEWRPIIGYEGLYEVSSFGRIKSLGRKLINESGHKYNRNKRIISLQPDGKRGYLKARVHKNSIGATISVHRAVAIAFIPNPENKPEVNHDKGIKTDNRVIKLWWSTGGENRLHAYHVLNVKRPLEGKFGKDHHTSKKVNQLTLSGEFIKLWDSMADAQRAGFGFLSSISACCKGKLKQVKGFKWEYA